MHTLEVHTQFLELLGSTARERPNLPVLRFFFDILFTCEVVITALPKNMQLEVFQRWELQMGEQAGRSLIDENATYPDQVQEALDELNSCKRRAGNDSDSGEEGGEDDNEEEEEGDTVQAAHSKPRKAPTKTPKASAAKAALKIVPDDTRATRSHLDFAIL
ncbi:hypothetical protein EV421DRAFT_1745554 [Armillaria borealis]|uniref:Uncharacterized protein n=1 Tax=Armillaria borealis TaxID=47425 RepID=A0AA39IUQ3_9AGAR|nr:hypothetical protein EV421DRAFT_1745554 [Armillaria borealis]